MKYMCKLFLLIIMLCVFVGLKAQNNESTNAAQETYEECVHMLCSRAEISNVKGGLLPSWQELLNTVNVKCAMCLTVAKNVNDSFSQYDKDEWSTYSLDQPVRIPLCIDKFVNFRLREVGAVRILSPPVKRGVPISTTLDGKWDKKLTETCEYFEHFVNRDELYKSWARNDVNIIQYLCMGYSIFRDCKNLVDPNSIPLCKPGDYLCLHRLIKWVHEPGTQLITI